MSTHGISVVCIVTSMLVLAGVGCAPTETGNPPQASVRLGLTAFSSAPSIARLAEAQGGLLIDRVTVNVVSLKLDPCAVNSPPLEVAPARYDLAAEPEIVELFGDQRLCGIRLELAPGLANENEMATSVYVHGTRTDGFPFEVISTATTALELRAPDGSAFGAEALLLGFDAGVWFTDIDVHGAHAGADGVARLDMTLNPELLVAFEARAPLSIALYEDTDEDAAIDEDEASAIALIE